MSDIAPPPLVSHDGPSSEHYALTCLVRTVYECPACGFVTGATSRHEPPTGLPRELRDVAAWQQEARARESEESLTVAQASARRAYDAHTCDGPS